MQQGEDVENERLSEVMDVLKERQRERTETKAAKPSTTLRKARLLRAGADRHGLLRTGPIVTQGVDPTGCRDRGPSGSRQRSSWIQREKRTFLLWV